MVATLRQVVNATRCLDMPITILEIWKAFEMHSIYVFNGRLSKFSLQNDIDHWKKENEVEPHHEWYYEIQHDVLKTPKFVS